LIFVVKIRFLRVRLLVVVHGGLLRVKEMRWIAGEEEGVGVELGEGGVPFGFESRQVRVVNKCVRQERRGPNATISAQP
jgi:hypothetical protein